MSGKNDIRQARAEMESAAERAQADSAPHREPRRYKLYDRIKDHVSLRTIDIVIAVTAALIIVLLVYGIATGNPAP